jgi:type II restriction/modification system DNA methylase subunit YeeA
MTPETFIKKWHAADLTERAAAQSHFNDLCALLGEPSPTDADPKGVWYCFEKGATKTGGGEGWADVWKRECFAWEYKGKRKDLTTALVQLQQYALALQNPPLLVVSDLDRIRVHTNWTNTVSEVHDFTLDDLRDPAKRQRLKWVFSDPEKLKPGLTRQVLTEQAATEFAQLAKRLRAQGHPPQLVAHFVNRLVFCMFAEDVNLLPGKMFRRMLEAALLQPDNFQTMAQALFAAMRSGGMVGFESVAWFNGGLFDTDDALPLTAGDIRQVLRAAQLDWAEIDPSILGTLFERGLDPDKRSQLGAHYTDRDKIMLIVEPVVTQPWSQAWNTVRADIAGFLEKAQASKASSVRTKLRNQADATYKAFLDKLRSFKVLDPACGSGNFLYLALRALKDFEHRVSIEAEVLGLQREFPRVGPHAVHGIEINPYAAELARVSVWIGEIQWMQRNGFEIARSPVLRPLDNIECRDAVLSEDGGEASWPSADVIIGNPPFLGSRLFLRTLGEEYSTRLRKAYHGRVSGNADLVCYWFAKSRRLLAEGGARQVGLVATKAIAKGDSRKVLDDLVRDGSARIFDAWTNEPWVVEGAAVRVAIICCAKSNDKLVVDTRLNGQTATLINTDLTDLPRPGVLDVTAVRPLSENAGLAFQGIKAVGPFDVSGQQAREWLEMPQNPNGRPNSDVLRRYLDVEDVVGRPTDRWIVDFGVDTTEAAAALYAGPFKHVHDHVLTARATNREARAAAKYWLHQRSRPAMRQALRHLSRFIVTPETSKHRVFRWASKYALPAGSLFVIARDDDMAFGILHSRIHEIWSTALGNRLGQGNDRRYNITQTFEPFPFPEHLTPNLPLQQVLADPRAILIAEAAKKLDHLREAWMNPPELVQRVPEIVPGYPDRLEPVNDQAVKDLHSRTLTALYNERPTWLRHAHADVDAAVAAAYGWPQDAPENDLLERLLALNRARITPLTI